MMNSRLECRIRFHSITEKLDARLTRRAIVYCGTQERRDAHIEVLNYASLLTR